MIKRILLGFALAFGIVSGASAQCSGVFAAGDVCGNSSAANATGSRTTIKAIFDRALGATDGMIPNRQAGIWIATNQPVLNGTLVINPAVGTTDRALVTNTTITGGPYPGALISNFIHGSIDSIVTGSGPPGQPFAPSWSLVQIAASVGATFNGTGGTDVGQAYGLSVGMVTNANNAANADLVGASFGFATTHTVGSRGYALTSAATAACNPVAPFNCGALPYIIGAEIVATVVPGAIVTDRAAVNLLSYSTGIASRMNAAISVQGGAAGGQFSQVIMLNTQNGALADALSTTADIIAGQTAQTINSIINLPLLTTTWVYNTKNATLNGSGVGTFGTTAVGGQTIINGPNGSARENLIQTAGATRWAYGVDAANNWQIRDTENARTPVSIARATGIVTYLNGFANNGVFSWGSVSQGDVIVGSSGGSNLVSVLNKDTNATRYLSNTGTSNQPAWAQINLANGVSGILGSSNGGAGAISGVLKANGSGTVSSAASSDLSDATAWSTYVPAFTCTTGTATWNNQAGRFKTHLGKVTRIVLTGTLTTNSGACTAPIIVTLPSITAFNGTSDYWLVGREVAVSGNIIIGSVAPNSTTASISAGATAVTVANGSIYRLAGEVENQ